jgi:hypothetical protein
VGHTGVATFHGVPGIPSSVLTKHPNAISLNDRRKARFEPPWRARAPSLAAAAASKGQYSRVELAEVLIVDAPGPFSNLDPIEWGAAP